MSHKDLEQRRLYNRNYYHSHSLSREKKNTQRAKRRQEIRDWYNEFKKELKCVECPEKHPATLQFHHIDPSTKLFDVADFGQGRSIATILKEMTKCEVLCANCHAKKHWDENRV